MPDGNGGRFLTELVEWLQPHIAYAWFLVLALWGGTANYISRVRRKGMPFSVIELIGEWTISGFAGLITAYLCSYLNLPFPMIAAFAGIAGHMGGRAIFVLEEYFTKKGPLR